MKIYETYAQHIIAQAFRDLAEGAPAGAEYSKRNNVANLMAKWAGESYRLAEVECRCDRGRRPLTAYLQDELWDAFNRALGLTDISNGVGGRLMDVWTEALKHLNNRIDRSKIHPSRIVYQGGQRVDLPDHQAIREWFSPVLDNLTDAAAVRLGRGADAILTGRVAEIKVDVVADKDTPNKFDVVACPAGQEPSFIMRRGGFGVEAITPEVVDLGWDFSLEALCFEFRAIAA